MNENKTCCDGCRDLKDIVTRQEKALTELTYALYLQKYLNGWHHLDRHNYKNMRELLKEHLKELPTSQDKTDKEIEELINMVL